jgi:hypothetical protein
MQVNGDKEPFTFKADSLPVFALEDPFLEFSNFNSSTADSKAFNCLLMINTTEFCKTNLLVSLQAYMKARNQKDISAQRPACVPFAHIQLSDPPQ